MPTGKYIRKPETIEMLRQNALKRNAQRIGKKHTEKTKYKQSIARKGRFGREKCGRWKGGICDDVKKYHRDYMKNRLKVKLEKLASRPKPDNCEICGIPANILKKGLAFDHNHETGKFRGWLCGRCNVSLGNVKDNIETLLSMIEYLKKNN